MLIVRLFAWALPAILLLCSVWISAAAAPPAVIKPPVVTPAPPASPVTPSTAAAPTVEQIQARLATLAATRDLPENERTQAQELYQQAISQLQAAKTYADRSASYQQLQQSAPAETAQLQQTLTVDPLPPPAATLSADDAAKQLAQTQTGLSDAQKRLNDLDQQLTVQQARPKSIPTELAGLKEQVADLDTKLQATSPAAITPLLADARLMALNTQRQAFNQQIAMLEQERLSYDTRLALLNAQRAVATQDVEQAQTRVQQLQNLLSARRRDEAAVVVQQTAQARQEAVAKAAVVQDVAAENTAISRRLEELVEQSDQISTDRTRFSEQLAQLTERIRGIRQQLGIAGFSDAIGPILLEERRALPEVRQVQRTVSERQQQIVQTRLEQYQTEQQARRARAVDDHLKELIARFDPQWPETQRQAVAAQLRPLLTDRQVLLEKLSSGYANLITELVALDDSQRKLSDQAVQYAALLDRYLLWIRSSPPLNTGWPAALGQALDWLTDPRHWQAAGQNLGQAVQQQPVIALGSLLGLLALLYYRRALIRRLGAEGDALGDVSRDNFGLTLGALGITGLLALPWPWLLGWLAWGLRGATIDADFSRGLSHGLIAAAFITINISLLRQMCRPRGIGMAHFGWSEAGCRLLRRQLGWYLWIGPLSIALIRLCETQPDTFYSDALGRPVFCISSTALTVLLWQVLNPRKPLLAALAASGARLVWRLRYIWYPLMVGSPLLLAALALTGYYYTALQLRDRLALSGWLLLGVVLFINLFLRWLNISQRRLALQRALAKREAQRVARAKEAAPASGEGVPEILHLPDLDLNTISEQTRSLISLMALLGLGFGLVLRGALGADLQGWSAAETRATMYFSGAVGGAS